MALFRFAGKGALRGTAWVGRLITAMPTGGPEQATDGRVWRLFRGIPGLER